MLAAAEPIRRVSNARGVRSRSTIRPMHPDSLSRPLAADGGPGEASRQFRLPAHVFPPDADRGWRSLIMLAVVAYIPVIASHPGALILDTYDGLYVAPWRTMIDAPSRWDPGRVLGTAADQTFGHGFPMSLWFWFWDAVGCPDWLAQRLWVGTIIFVAGVGVVYLLRVMDWVGPGWLIAALAYQCSPYVLRYASTESSVLLAWAALPWLIGFTARSLDQRNWRGPARFAVVLGLAASANLAATTALLVGPAMWIVYSVGAVRDVPWRSGLAAAARITVLSTVVCLWWIIGLNTYPYAVAGDARFHDPMTSVERATTSSELVRGLGDWRLYDRGSIHWVGAADWLITSPVLLALSFLLPAVALTSMARVRFHNRLYFVALVAAGAILAVGAAPGDDPEPFGRAVHALSETRFAAFVGSTQRALPLMWLGFAVCAAAGVRRLVAIRPHRATAVRIGGVALALSASIPYVGAQVMSNAPAGADGVPDYWFEAAAFIDALRTNHNLIELPAVTNPEYDWGTTNEPISLTLVDRPVGVFDRRFPSEQGTVDVLSALDERLRLGDVPPRAMAPIARMLAADAILVRHDTPADRDAAASVSALLAAAPDVSLLQTFGTIAGGSPALEVFGVEPMPGGQVSVAEPDESVRTGRIRVATKEEAVVYAGGGGGLIDLAASGTISGREVFINAADLTDGGVANVVRDTPNIPLVLTDSLRWERRVVHVLTDQRSPTEAPTRLHSGAPGDVAWRPSESRDPITFARVALDGVGSIDASGYGSVERALPQYRPTAAFDGDPATTWIAGIDGDPTGQQIGVTFEQPQQLSGLSVTQPAGAFAAITRVRVVFAGPERTAVEADLVGSSGVTERIEFDSRTATGVTIEILDVRSEAPGRGAGFSEIDVGVGTVTETIALPDDLAVLGEGSVNSPLTILLRRWRTSNQIGEGPETHMVREFDLDSERAFTLEATISGVAPGTDCRGDLLTIDGQGVGLRAEDDPDTPGAVEMVACEPTVDLAAGRHTLVTMMGSPTVPLNIDTIRLSAASERVESAPSQLTALIVHENATSYTIDLTGASQPMWVLFGATSSPGWRGEVNGGLSTSRTMFNGFGVAYPLVLGSNETTSFVVRQAPQRTANVGVIMSAAGMVLALGLSVGRRRRRPVERYISIEEPIRYVHPSVIVLTTLGVFGIAAGPIPGLAAGATALVLEQRFRRHSLVAWIPGILLLAAGIAKAVWTVVEHAPVDLAWPAATPLIDLVVWIAIAVAVSAALSNSDRRLTTNQLPLRPRR
jgi:Alpha-(1->3)-arabinofuranosyltransferase